MDHWQSFLDVMIEMVPLPPDAGKEALDTVKLTLQGCGSGPPPAGGGDGSLHLSIAVMAVEPETFPCLERAVTV